MAMDEAGLANVGAVAATAVASASALASTPQVVFDNSSVWHNFTSWTAQRLGLAMNMTKLAPSLEDLVLAGPRMVMKLGKLGSFISFPDAIDGFGQRVIPESTDPGIFNALSTDAGASLVQSAAPSATATAGTGADPTAFTSRFSMEGARGLGSVFSYATSKWALCCIGMAVVINRTHIFAATRRRLRLQWPMRLALRIIPIILLVIQARTLLQSIQCQTSPDFAQLRWGNATKSSDLMFSQSNPFLHGLSSSLLFGASDEDSCRSIHMVPWDGQEQAELSGSMSRLWPLFGTFCLSQFVEVLSCTLQGRPSAAETGMTLFEHSLAFAEADAAISNQLGWGLFTNGSETSPGTTTGQAVAVTRAMIMRRVNTSPEVLLIAFLSAMNHVTSHVLGVFNLQARFRLISTGFWAMSFMACIVWSALNFSLDDAAGQGLLRYPTVSIIGFIPHVLVFCGIFVCGLIYFLTLLLSALASPETSPEGHRLSFKDRLRHAHGNMQANVSLSEIRIRMDMDFYTALLRAGFGAITMASEAVYLNEDSHVSLKQYTWLEDERFRELESLRMEFVDWSLPGSRYDTVGAIGLVPIKDGQSGATSGYARERAAQKVPKNNTTPRRGRDGVGAAERSGRWLMALEYMMHIGRLILTTSTLILLRILSFLGMRNPPQFLRRWSQRPKASSSENQKSSRRGHSGSGGWSSATDGGASGMGIAQNDRVDIEAEMRRRIQASEGTANIRDGDGYLGRDPRGNAVDENELDTRLYSWWLGGGWWGNTDASGDYTPGDGLDDPDFDTTSVISTTETSVSELDWESDDEELAEGQRTPTQTSFDHVSSRRNFSRESTPVADIPMAPAELARLLHPQSPEEREEARALAVHLTSESIMTRSRFRLHEQRQRAQVLLTNRQHFRLGPEKMSAEEEARRLEQLLLSRRRAAAEKQQRDGNGNGTESMAAAEGGGGESWATGAAGLGPDGPQCVVCQCAPRTIIVWPCRCLSLCDDCRVSLAMNNFDKCVCCRREVISFSRIYVP
ncbi:hypothetical protein QBC37DRAFT_418712 [Rhypophila decipiens]|uniref:Uncharacterized protein n=1 Tax=Rhypophila decipiens TaxID=261697 RepID=A0AAN6YD52_9PEZI|nr:hypothetical protein QBC37DRAFT_418712 [Rhypophila decipiens]